MFGLGIEYTLCVISALILPPSMSRQSCPVAVSGAVSATVSEVLSEAISGISEAVWGLPNPL